MKDVVMTVFLGLVATCNLSGQADWKTVKAVKGAYEAIAADPIGHFYLIKAGVLSKYSGTGDSLYSWSDPSKGNISRVDVTDPLRILVFQQDFNLIRFLNNRLAPLSDPVNLDNLGITRTLAVATSRQGGVWVLDGNEYRLRRYDAQLTLVSESAPLNLPVMQDKSGIRLFESGDYLWIIIPGQEIRQFDTFGNTVVRIPIRVVSASPANDKLLLVYPDQIMLFAGATDPENRLVQWQGNALMDGCIQQNRLWILTASEVIILSR